MNIGIDMGSGSDFTRIVLFCTCCTVEDFACSEDAYDAGWRFSRTRMAEAPYKAVCPSCMAKREQKWRQREVAKYGVEAVERMELIMREKHR